MSIDNQDQGAEECYEYLKECKTFINNYGENEMNQPTSNETVDIIASGYEWQCPNCEKFIHEIEIKEFVTCHNCLYTYETNPVEHAHG